jgi:hypothetical protein
MRGLLVRRARLLRRVPHRRRLLRGRRGFGRVGELVWRSRVLEAAVAVLSSMRRRRRRGISKLLRAVLHVALRRIRDAWRRRGRGRGIRVRWRVAGVVVAWALLWREVGIIAHGYGLIR